MKKGRLMWIGRLEEDVRLKSYCSYLGQSGKECEKRGSARVKRNKGGVENGKMRSREES